MTEAVPLTEVEERALIRAAMKLIARRTSPARAAAARRNGKKGGRPRRKKAVDKPSRGV